MKNGLYECIFIIFEKKMHIYKLGRKFKIRHILWDGFKELCK